MILKSVEKTFNFFNELQFMECQLDSFARKYEMTVHEIQLLSIIYKHEEVQLRKIIQKIVVKPNHINKAVKLLYDKKIIKKIRLPYDERTVQLSIEDNQKEKVELILKEFSNMISEFKGFKDRI